MDIYGIGYHTASSNCYQFYLLTQIKRQFSELKIQNNLPVANSLNQESVLIINITMDNAYHLFGEGQQTPENAYTIFIVHELDRSIYPILKLADQIIYSSKVHQIMCEEHIGMPLNSMTLPLPTGDFEVHKENSENALMYLDYEFQPQNISEYIETAKVGLEYFNTNSTSQILKIKLLMTGPSGGLKEWYQFAIQLKKLDQRFELINHSRLERLEYTALIQKTSCAWVHSPIYPIYDFLESVKNGDSWIVHLTFGDKVVLSDLKYAGVECNDVKSMNAWNFQNESPFTFDEFNRVLKEHIDSSLFDHVQRRINAFDSVEVDQLKDLNIVYGKPLNNDYIFSVCFRNQQDKIARCIRSIAHQNLILDFGIVLIDDHSSDNSLDEIMKVLSEYPELNACVVSNKVNKKASRNFYNVGQLLTTNNESVIIEVDGDDFVANGHVLDVLKAYYDKGALKTNGSFEFYSGEEIEEAPEHMNEEDIERQHANLDYSRPWVSDHCNAWLSMRTCKRRLLANVELKFFLDRHTKDWLTDRHDAAVQPRIIELAEKEKKGSCVYIPKILYRYDLTGENHDHESGQRNAEYLKLFQHLDKIWHPLPLCPSIV